ncbi:peptidase s8 and s53 subtilisin kexin sedolisin [Colletotrichum scovillei]|uniref:Peptidase s8 and s53 subtilisin kexin sedolisin n=1 Tax=Colletotrichum scovillei TaxID=1209932 RepID=A0A9P7R192_9PEZI|nr:peptidase s8 and s53 subtilisin kexin sedolisin [Colletotrichum scovillei]KAG7056600.1 peptidase s8 and s53 subtilisin kexin sedolisin [Colletotrichum scovillei]KAG7066526.1 peptidase s8 and s53 subtilisin kexin sedolisin [Colletotrichum scovillei]
MKPRSILKLLFLPQLISALSLGTSLSATEQISPPATTPLTIPTSSRQLSSSAAAASDTSFTALTTSLLTSLTSNTLIPTSATNSGPSTSTSAQVAETVIFFVTPGPPTTVKRNLKKRMPGGFVNHNTNADRQSCNTATVFTLIAGQLLDGGVPVHYSPGESHRPFSAGETPPNNAITTTFDVYQGVLRFYHPSLPGIQASFCQDATGQVHVTFTSRPPDCEPVSLLAYGDINILGEHFRHFFKHLVVAHNQSVLQLIHHNSKLVNYHQHKFFAQQLKHVCGAFFAAYVFDRLSAPCQELIRVLADSTKNPRNLNLTLLTQGRSPLGSGVTPLVSWTNNPNQANNPTDIYGVRGPTGTTWSNSCEVIQHRGYLKFNQAGTFTITIDVPDDYGFVWLGGSASSTAPPFSASGSQLVGDGFLRQSIRNYDLVIANTQTYVPFRAWFANAGGPGHFNMPLPAGVEFVATCPDKSATPVFPLWAAERWSL